LQYRNEDSQFSLIGKIWFIRPWNMDKLENVPISSQ